MIVCNKCKEEVTETGFPLVPIARSGGRHLLILLTAENEELDSVEESSEFGDEFKGDWCESCARAKIADLMASFVPGAGADEPQTT